MLASCFVVICQGTGVQVSEKARAKCLPVHAPPLPFKIIVWIMMAVWKLARSSFVCFLNWDVLAIGNFFECGQCTGYSWVLSVWVNFLGQSYEMFDCCFEKLLPATHPNSHTRLPPPPSPDTKQAPLLPPPNTSMTA